MKATMTLGAASLAALLAGCSGARVLTDVPDDCPATTTTLVLRYGPGRITLDNECTVVTGPTTVTISIMPAEQGKVRTKNRGNGWLNRRNDANPAQIEFPVPRKKPNHDFEEYKFEIIVEDVGVLDPRIVIQ